MPEEAAAPPVEEAPVEETPVEETSIEEAPVEEAPAPVAANDIVDEEPAINQIDSFPVEEPGAEAETEADAPGGGESQWTNEQFALANAMGMSPEDVKAFGDPSMFDRVIGGLAQRAVHARQQQNQAAQQQAAYAAQMQHQQQQDPQAAQQQQQVAADYQFPDPEDYDDGVLRMNDNNNRRFQQMEAYMAALAQQNQAMTQQNQLVQSEMAGRELDSIFNSMDEKIFGRGRLSEVPQELGQNRIQAANEVARLGQVHMQGGEQPPSLSQLAGRAANSLFGEKFTQNALDQASKQSRKVAEQSSAVPTRQEGVSDRGYEAAIRAAANWQRENNPLDDYTDAFPG